MTDNWNGNMETRYGIRTNGQVFGPFTEDELIGACKAGLVNRDSAIWYESNPSEVFKADDLIDFDAEDNPPQPQEVARRPLLADEGEPELGESFRCPYCRTVTDLSDVLSVSVSPGLVGDPVLGDGEQMRFAPTRFTSSGLALDLEGGVCTEIACPRCHMALPRPLLELPQTVMSVIGAAGAGKSVFLASCIWQCRTLLGKYFGISFMDLDPVANRWINAYEEKLFFQEDDERLQQIEKTDLQASNVTRTVTLDGDSMLLPLPSFFRLMPKGAAQGSLVVYDSAGEHFRAGADTQSSAVTLNMINSDTLFFMYDPSADPRFRPMLERGEGTARNYAQRQDILLAEMSSRIIHHLGNRAEASLTRPLIFGVSKADLLRSRLPLGAPPYRPLANGTCALDVAALKEMSDATEALLAEVVPEVVVTARNIAKRVWFVPISALGHNPMREGVKPINIKPVFAELPVVLTLAAKGMIPIVNGSL